MTGYQIFSLIMSAVYGFYGTKILIESNKDKDDPVYGQSITLVIWIYIVAIVSLLSAVYPR